MEECSCGRVLPLEVRATLGVSGRVAWLKGKGGVGEGEGMGKGGVGKGGVGCNDSGRHGSLGVVGRNCLLLKQVFWERVGEWHVKSKHPRKLRQSEAGLSFL